MRFLLLLLLFLGKSKSLGKTRKTENQDVETALGDVAKLRKAIIGLNQRITVLEEARG